MTPTKEQQAEEYAKKKIENEYGISRETFIEAGCRFGYDDVVQAYSDGHTACGQSMWRSVEEERPQKNGDYLICTKYGEIEIAFWEDNYWLGNDSYPVRCATHWRELPSLPDTTTENP